MKNSTLALFVSLTVLVGFPIVFLLISLGTGQWNYLTWSIAPSFAAGFTGLKITRNQIRKEKKAQ
ncbi:hypothetical protein [Bacillus sp. SG-1]|uniref:hypothetical protein n=1 Tax=Bacillus sp. SG-1 TaxID=161544 RepID=UPI000154322C|nr:hypothetical protein [Bacillus sp. SG-1]EDL66468.1 hypothetical protein BSG1_03910 [Bacillus sp. SG-1]